MDNVQEQPFVFVNINSPNKTSERCTFFQEIQTELDNPNIEADCDVIIGGDFNVILDPEFDGLGGKPKLRDSVKIIEQIWPRKNPVIQRRLDFWLTSSSLQEDVESVNIIKAIKSDHSAITLFVNGIEDERHGPSLSSMQAQLMMKRMYHSLEINIARGLRKVEKLKILVFCGTIFNIKFDKKRLSIVNSRSEKEEQH